MVIRFFEGYDIFDGPPPGGFGVIDENGNFNRLDNSIENFGYVNEIQEAGDYVYVHITTNISSSFIEKILRIDSGGTIDENYEVVANFPLRYFLISEEGHIYITEYKATSTGYKTKIWRKSRMSRN